MVEWGCVREKKEEELKYECVRERKGSCKPDRNQRSKELLEEGGGSVKGGVEL